MTAVSKGSKVDTGVWDPDDYVSMSCILIVGDIDLSFATFLMPHLPQTTSVVNTSLLSEDQLLDTQCGDKFRLNKKHLLHSYSKRIQILHGIDVRNLARHFERSFDCVLFVYPQATNSSQFIRSRQFVQYHRQNSMLLQDYILNAANVLSWNSAENRIDFVIKENHIRNWINNMMAPPSNFLSLWTTKYNIAKTEFSPSTYIGYQPRNEHGKAFDPGVSYMISSKTKPLKVIGAYCNGLNIVFRITDDKAVIGHIGFGKFDLRRDFKRAYCAELGIYCRNLGSVVKIMFARCNVKIEGETFHNGEQKEYDRIFMNASECAVISQQQFTWLEVTTKEVEFGCME